MEKDNIKKIFLTFEKEAIQQIPINKYKLDVECESNGSLYRYWSSKMVTAEKDRNEKKNKIKEVESETELFIRKNARDGLFEGVKITDKSVEALVRSNEKVKQAYQDYFDAEWLVGELESIVKPFEQRAKLISVEKDLWCAGYFSTPDTTQRQNVNDDYKTKERERLKQRSKMQNGNCEE